MADTLIQYAMQVPDERRRGVVKTFASGSILFDLLNFIDLGEAMHYDYSEEAGLPNIGFRALGEDFSHTEGEYILNPKSEGTSIMGGVVQTDRQLLSRKPTRIAAKTRSAGLVFAKKFFDGDSSGASKEFDGLAKRLGTGSQVISAGANGGYLDLDNLEKLIDMTEGPDSQKRLLMGKDMRRTLGATIRAQGATSIQMAEWQGNLRPTSYAGVQIAIVGEDEEGSEILGFDETQGSYTTAGSIYCVRFGSTDDEDGVQGLAKNAGDGFLEVEDQGVSGSTDKTLVEGRVGLAVFNGKSAARYMGIKEGTSS